MFAAVGLGGLKRQQQHFDKQILKKEIPVDPVSQSNMQHGIENEKHGIATLIGKISSVTPVR